MITVHSEYQWINQFLPKRFNIRPSNNLSDESTGNIAAQCFWDTPDDAVDKIKSLSNRYDHVVIYVCEPWPGRDFLGNLCANSPSNVMIFSDVIWDKPYANHQYIGNWFMTHSNLYTQSQYCMNRLGEIRDEVGDKRYRFDALLGVVRPHRVRVHEWWKQSACKEQILLTFHGPDSTKGQWHDPCLFLRTNFGQDSDDPGMLKNTPWTYVDPTDGAGYRIGTQNIVPVEIYNDCWGSIITEGFSNSLGTRLTEKTAKALVGKRFFVYFGAVNDLARMRDLGFHTFGDIVDESYDNIQDDNERWHAAWKVVEWVCQQDPSQIFWATHHARVHNQNVFLNTDWFSNLRRHLLEICDKY